MSVVINDIKLEDYGLKLLYNYTIESPEVKENIVEIKGTSKFIDMTESLSNEVPYNRRVITLPFLATPNNRFDWHQLVSELMNQFHGKHIELTLPNDPKYSWSGRCSVSADYEVPYSNIVMTFNVEPFKKSYQNTEDWEWDTFDFEEDVANDFSNYIVNGTLEIEAAVSSFKSGPVTISSSTAMKLVFNNKVINIVAGVKSYSGIKLRKGSNILKFEGNGTIYQINFMGESL